MICPTCGASMAAQTLDGYLGTTVSIDLCLPCQAFWFDSQESLRLSPGAVLILFRIIGERALEARAPAATHPSCPRCHLRLLPTHDRQRNTPFQYLRCPKEHGRLISFIESHSRVQSREFLDGRVQLKAVMGKQTLADLARNDQVEVKTVEAME